MRERDIRGRFVLHHTGYGKQKRKLCLVCKNEILASPFSQSHRITCSSRCFSKYLEQKIPARFWSQVIKSSHGCWNWNGAKRHSRRNYGDFKINSRHRLAHGIAYQLAYGTIPKGKYVCHKCDNEFCVCPTHLFLGTQRDNMQDASYKGRLATGKKWQLSHLIRRGGLSK